MQYTNSKLKNAAGHIKYEIDMLNFAVNQLQKKLDTAKNIFIEIFVIHSRNLYEFLFTSYRKYPDDMIWSDFLTPNQQNKFSPETINFDVSKANKQLAHLSYKRNYWEKRKNKSWNITEIHIGLLKSYALFLETMSEPKRKWFK